MHVQHAALDVALLAFDSAILAAPIVAIGSAAGDAGTSGSFEIVLTNPDPTSVFIGGTQLDVSVPAGSPVAFDGATTSTATPYLFAGTGLADFFFGGQLSSDVFPNQSFVTLDVELVAPFVEIMPGESFGLAQVEFTIDPAGIPGTAVPIDLDLIASMLVDELGQPVAFTVQSGSITVTPEPTSLAAWGLGSLLLCGYGARRGRPRDRT